MTIGQRILAARQASGLSQRELAGENITRNMLSAIEHDRAKPSLDTLVYLSEALGKPVSYFLGEDTPSTEGYDEMVRARQAYDGGEYRACLEVLAKIPDGEVLGREVRLLNVLASLTLAEQALSDGRVPYARELLDQAEKAREGCPYFTSELARKLAILRAKAAVRSGQLSRLVREIPEDGVLLLRARAALEENRFADARRHLEAQDHRDEQWHYLMGEALFGMKEFKAAAECYHAAEKTMGKQVRRRLQICYAELKDFEKAYRYATME